MEDIYDEVRRIAGIVWALFVLRCRRQPVPPGLPEWLVEADEFMKDLFSTIDTKSLGFEDAVMFYWDMLRITVNARYGAEGLSVLSTIIRGNFASPLVSHVESAIIRGVKLILGNDTGLQGVWVCNTGSLDVARRILAKTTGFPRVTTNICL